MAKKKAVLLTINEDEIARAHQEGIQKIADNIKSETLSTIISRCRNIITNPVDIDMYRGFAEGLADLLEIAYKEVGWPNMFHHPIKQINPEVYGKPDTLRAQCRSLLDAMLEVQDLQEAERKQKKADRIRRRPKK